MSKKQSGTARLLQNVTSGKAQQITEEPEAEIAISVVEEDRPQKVKKTFSVSIDTVVAIQEIQGDAVRKGGRKPTGSEIVDEAIKQLLESKELML